MNQAARGSLEYDSCRISVPVHRRSTSL